MAIITDASAKPLSGTVDYVAAMVDPATKAVTVRIVVPNTDLLLRRDMFVRVQIKSAHEHHGILVPVVGGVARRSESAVCVRGRGRERICAPAHRLGDTRR